MRSTGSEPGIGIRRRLRQWTREVRGAGRLGGSACSSDLTKELIIDALKVNKGKRAAARQFGITEQIMGLHVEKYGLT